MDLNNYIVGGYFVTKPIQQPIYLNESYVPNSLISVSICLSEFGGLGQWSGGSPKKLGVSDEKLADAEVWSQTALGHSYGYPNVFYTLENARKYVQSFIPNPSDDLLILCVALQTDLAKDFLRTEKQDPKRGTYEVLKRWQTPPIEGTILGYEPLCYFYDLDHTWYCNYLHKHAYETRHIIPNSLGLIDRYEDAQKVAETALTLGAEDGLWLPWLVIQYPISDDV